MKNIASIIFLLIINFSFSQKIKTKTEIRKDKDGKETLKIEEHFYKNGDNKLTNYFVKDEKIMYTTFTEKENNEIREAKYDNFNAIKESALLKFDDNDELVFSEYQIGENGPKYIESYKITYDSKKNITKLVRLLGTEEKGWEYIYEYNKYNKKTKSISKFEDVIREEIVYEYDKKTRIKQSIYSYKDDVKELIETITFEYDSKGNLIKETHKYENGKPNLVETFEYDKKGKLISEVHLKNGVVDIKKEFSYIYF